MNISGIDALIMSQGGIKSACRAEIEQMQLDRLNALLIKEKERGGFYRNLPESLSSLDELKRLPFTAAEDLARNAFGFLLTSQSDVVRVISDETSGTTGIPKRVFYTEKDCENTIELFMAGLEELVFPGSATMICMPFSGPFGLGELIAEAISRLGARPVKAGPFLSYGQTSKLIESEKPDSFVGFPVQLLSILRACGKGSLKRALISGDSCAPSIVALCEEYLGSKLFPHYGSREMALGGAISCKAHSGMHLRENHVIAEIIDENGLVLPHGEWGELVITTIGMQAMPLIRYKTGDFTRIIPGRCACKSEAFRLDTVTRAGGREMAALDERLFAIPGIIDFYAARGEHGLEIFALSDGTVSEAAVREAIGNEVSVKIRKYTPDDRALYPGKRQLNDIKTKGDRL